MGWEGGGEMKRILVVCLDDAAILVHSYILKCNRDKLVKEPQEKGSGKVLRFSCIGCVLSPGMRVGCAASTGPTIYDDGCWVYAREKDEENGTSEVIYVCCQQRLRNMSTSELWARSLMDTLKVVQEDMLLVLTLGPCPADSDLSTPSVNFNNVF